MGRHRAGTGKIKFFKNHNLTQKTIPLFKNTLLDQSMMVHDGFKVKILILKF